MASGLTFFTYHDFSVRSAGAVADAATSHEHRSLCQILGLAMIYDRLDAANCGTLELAARRLIMIERAVRVNPRAPSFEGLAAVVQQDVQAWEAGAPAPKESQQWPPKQGPPRQPQLR